MGLPLWIAVFVGSIAVLLKSSDFFIDSAEKVGAFFGLPSFIIGVIIVAIGTSLPELVSSIIAVTEGSSEIVVGNVLGSNIANICLVLGLGALVGKNFIIRYDLMQVDLPFLIGSSILVFFMIWDGVFSLPEAILCLVGLAVYVFYSLRVKKPVEEEEERISPKWHVWLFLFASPVGIFFGAKYTVQAVIAISEIAGIGSEIIALSAVALGTSLPEVFVSVSAARKGHPEIVVGNIIGSNIFNTFAVMGVPGVMTRLVIPKSVLSFAAPVSVGVTLVFFVITIDKRVNPWIGGLLFIFYIFFLGTVFHLF